MFLKSDMRYFLPYTTKPIFFDLELNTYSYKYRAWCNFIVHALLSHNDYVIIAE